LCSSRYTKQRRQICHKTSLVCKRRLSPAPVSWPLSMRVFAAWEVILPSLSLNFPSRQSGTRALILNVPIPKQKIAMALARTPSLVELAVCVENNRTDHTDQRSQCRANRWTLRFSRIRQLSIFDARAPIIALSSFGVEMTFLSHLPASENEDWIFSQLVLTCLDQNWEPLLYSQLSPSWPEVSCDTAQNCFEVWYHVIRHPSGNGSGWMAVQNEQIQPKFKTEDYSKTRRVSGAKFGRLRSQYMIEIRGNFESWTNSRGRAAWEIVKTCALSQKGSNDKRKTFQRINSTMSRNKTHTYKKLRALGEIRCC